MTPVTSISAIWLRKTPTASAAFTREIRIEWLYHRPAEEVYDLETDPFENRNLAADPKFAAIKAKLSRELDAWMAQQGDQGMATELQAPTRQPRNTGKEDAAPKSTKQRKKKR